MQISVVARPAGHPRFGPDQRSVVVGNLKQPAGSLLQLTLSSPQGGDVNVTVPVVAPQNEYATVTPPAN